MKRLNLYILITFVITWWPLPACSTRSAATIPRESISPEAVQKALIDSDNLFKQREDPDKLRAAIKTLAAVRDLDNRNYQVEWTFAKYNYFLGKLSTNGDEAETALGAGRDAGKIASRIDPQKPDGHFWYAANLGELSKRSPITVGLQSVSEIKEAMNKVIELEPGYQSASAYDALAQVELATRLKGGDARKAVELLEKGQQIAPENSNIRLHLGEAYLAVKRDADARKELDYVLQMKP
ncbi:MAG TPA: tetratricopeptide repeat protein, partial [Pyrinomonadaceae bacterium]|nr:tetratricopeptide repeat protein [Pyrinomonadaceae bacterium]